MKKLIFAIIAIAILGTSCNMQQSLSQNRNVAQTSVVLQGANYKVLGQVKGEAIGSNAKKLVVENAYADMMKNADLKDSQAVVFINYERITKLSGRTHVVVNGTKIEFTK